VIGLAPGWSARPSHTASLSPALGRRWRTRRGGSTRCSRCAAGRFHALGILMHDCSHMPLRSKDLRIHLLEILCAYPLATTLDAMRYAGRI
jgi:hypothetical protein